MKALDELEGLFFFSAGRRTIPFVSSSRKDAEKEFYDRCYQRANLNTLNGFYLQSAGVLRYERGIYDACAERDVLEYGCGIGGHAARLADRGARVLGIDISEQAIERARSSTPQRSDGRLRFLREDAESLSFPDASFDLVCGTGILHHLDLARAIAEVRRVLRPGGKAIFYEPVAHNPLINIYRMLTPADHTEDEHPLTVGDIRAIQDGFASAQAEFFDFFSIGAIPLLRLPGGMTLLRALEWIDRRILAAPSLRRWAGTVVLEGIR